MAATAPASEGQTAFLNISSLDRYPSLIASQDPAQQTTPTDITYTIPGLSKASTLQLAFFGLGGGMWNVPNTPGTYANVINVIYNGVTTLITLPFDVPITLATANLTIIQTLLRNTLNDQSIVFGLAFVSNQGGFQSYTTSPAASQAQFVTWYSLNGTLGFSRVTTLNGVDITGYTQLFDLLGLAYQVNSGVPTSNITALGQWGIATRPFFTVSPSLYYDIVSPDLDPLYPDLNTNPNANQYGTLINRVLLNASTSPGYSSSFGVTGYLKTFKTKGTNTLRLRIVDSSGRPISTKAPIPQVCKYLSTNGSYTGSGGSGVITITGTPALSLSGLVVGDRIETYASTIVALCGIWTITGLSASTITIACPYVGTNGVTVAGPYNIAGNTTAYGGNTEYICSFLVNYGSSVPVTTT